MGKFRDKPKILSEEKENAALKILSEADRPASVKASQTSTVRKKKPWEKITEKKAVIVFSFRVPKKEMQKLKYIAQQTSMSLNTICLRAIKSCSKKILNELEKETDE